MRARFGMPIASGFFILANAVHAAAPPNDDFNTPVYFNTFSLPYSTTLDVSEATSGPGDPPCFNSGYTVWFRYDSYSYSTLDINTSGSSYDTRLCVFIWTGFGFIPVASNDDSAGQQSRVVFNTTAFQSYHVLVGAPSGGPAGLLNLSAAEVPPPPFNDQYWGAPQIYSLPASFSLNTSSATASPDDPFCFGRGATVWYFVYLPYDAVVDVDSLGSDYDTTLSVYYSGFNYPPTSPQIACNDDFGGQPTSKVSFAARAFTLYYIMVGTSGDAPGGNLVLNAQQGTFVAPPPNDNSASATVIPALPFSDRVSTYGATLESGEPVCGDVGSAGATVWYTFTPASTTLVHLLTPQSDYSTNLAVYSPTPSASNQITCNVSAFGAGEAVFQAWAGSSYYIQVTSRAGVGGNLGFSATALPGPLAGGVLVTGGGSWDRIVGNNNFGQLINTVTINASRSKRGAVTGKMTWTSVYNVLPGGGGQAISGYPWVITIDRIFWLASDWIFVEGLVTSAGQTPEDIGRRIGFFVTDRGNGVSTPPDLLGNGEFTTPLQGGNFTIQSTNR